MEPIVICGAGLAGWGVARELRRLAPEARVTIVTRDGGDFYAKPSLSNALAAGKTAQALVTTPGQALARELGVTLLARTEVVRLDRASRRVATSAGELGYSKLVLALGADPIRLPLGGNAAREVVSVNDLDAYRSLREALRPGQHVAILGAGLIGCEFANDLAASGHRVTVLEPGERPLASLMPAAAGAALARALGDAGVRWRFGDAALDVERVEDGLCIRTRRGERLAADLVLSAVGLRPRCALALEAGLAAPRGIVVDAFGATGDPSIFALGDCAEYSGRLMPFVQPIMIAARAIARTLAGSPTPIAFGTMPIVVKTPACPVALVPAGPPDGGRWHTEADDDELEMHFIDGDGRLAGFVLTGKRGTRRQALARTIDEARARHTAGVSD